MTRGPKLALILGLAVFVFSGTALVALLRRPLPPVQSVGGENSDLSIPPFTLTTQNNQTITNGVFIGHVTIVDFVFAHCPFICPTLTSKMRELSSKLNGPKFQFLSISVDPTRDTPEVLKDYAERQNADLTRWRFATGEPSVVTNIVRNGLKSALENQPSQPITLPGGGTMDNILHPSWFVLVGPKGEVVGIFRPTQEDSFNDLVVRANELAKALPAKELPTQISP